MLTSTGSRLFRFLLSLVIRLRLSVGRIALALRARFASLWRLIPTFARRRGQSQIRLHANDVPQIQESMAEEEGSGTLAVLPVRRRARWEDELSKYQDPTSSDQFKFDPHPATPEAASQRYKPRRASHGNGPSDIPVGQRTILLALPPIPEGWKRHVHPEGNVLFHHDGLRIFTESDISLHHNHKEILFYATALIQQAIHTDGVIMDELTEIVLNVDDDRRWHYYFVDHRHRLLFWVHPIKLREGLGTDLQGITGYDHISTFHTPFLSLTDRFRIFGRGPVLYIVYDMESRSHCEYYPYDRTIPKTVLDDLRGMLNYAKTDMLTSDYSFSPFAQDELVALLDLINSLKDDQEIADPISIWIIARLMSFFTEDQFLNFRGQQCARLSADIPLFGPQTWNRSITFKVVNVVMLGSPSEHAVRLQRVWIDGAILPARWRDFINKLTTELGQYPIFSTVILGLNFSLLNVIGVSNTSPPAGQIQTIIYCSMVSAIGSIVLSFALLKVYNAEHMNAAAATKVMWTLSRTKWGMACLAITHNLPIACLVWSIMLFSAALAAQIFGSTELPTVVTLGVACLILVLFGFMTYFVTQLFSHDDVEYMDTSVGSNTSPAKSQHDVEQRASERYAS